MLNSWNVSTVLYILVNQRRKDSNPMNLQDQKLLIARKFRT